MKTLVTGGAGFLGSTLVDRLLAEGHAVDVIDDLSTGRLDNLKDARADRRNELAIHHVDLRQAEVVELIERREPEVVFHLASRSAGDDALEAEVTVLSTLRVLEGARRAGARKIVFASSASVYGIVDDEAMPVRESQPQRPVTIGGVAKKAAADAMSAYREVHGIEFTALALSTVYGPRDERSPVAVFDRNLRAGRPTTITGDGRQTRDLLYVDDAVDAFVRAAERGSGLLVNIGTGVETSIIDLFRLAAKYAGMPNELPVHEQDRPAERRRVALDAGRARIHLGWSSWTTVDEGVADTLAASVAR
jgi:UDP-glucose 4-epimerase